MAFLQTIWNLAVEPYMRYDVYCTPSRNGSTVNYVFEIVGWFVKANGDSGGGYLGTGGYLRFNARVDNVTRTVDFKGSSESLNFSSGQSKTVSVTVPYNNITGQSSWGTVSMTSDYFTSGVFDSTEIWTPAIGAYYKDPTAPASMTIPDALPLNKGYTLKWAAGKDGQNNAIKQYHVSSRIQRNGSWGSWTSWSNMGKITSVGAPAVSSGTRIQWKVKAVGTYSDSGETLSNIADLYTDPGSPKSITIPGAVKLGSNYTVTWPAGSAGQNNAIKQYYISWRRRVNGTWQGWNSWISNGTRTSYTASNPSGDGVQWKVKTVGQYSESGETLSSAANLYSDPAAPASVSISPGKALMQDTLTVSWPAASAGSNNAIQTYYYSFRKMVNGKWQSWSSWANLGSKTSLTAIATSGEAIQYKVKAIAKYSETGETTSGITYLYTKPAAPTITTLPDKGKTRKVTIRWTKPIDYSDNRVIQYQMLQQESADGVTWDKATVIATVDAGVLAYTYILPRRKYYRFAVKAIAEQTSLGDRNSAASVWSRMYQKEQAGIYAADPFSSKWRPYQIYAVIGGVWRLCRVFLPVAGKWTEGYIGDSKDGTVAGNGITALEFDYLNMFALRFDALQMTAEQFNNWKRGT